MLNQTPNFNQLSQYVVNLPGWEGVKWKLYDFLPYPAIGTPQLTFFQRAAGSAGVTLSDTNMVASGVLPANQAFLVTSIELLFMPTTPTPAGPVLTNLPAATTQTTAALQAQNIINDVYNFYSTGNLQFIVGSKPYLIEAPMGKFPPKSNFRMEGAIGVGADSNLAEALADFAGYARMMGRPYYLNPANILLQSQQNFSITLNWPEGNQAITSAARVGCIFDGFLYRRSQ